MILQENGRIAGLDGLRGFAAVMVLIDHMRFYGYFHAPWLLGFGKIGVELFYVLSGFLMGLLYLERDFSKNGLRNYLAARVSRIFPLFYAALIGGVGLLLATGHSGYAFDDVAGFSQNALLLKGTGVLWSVPVEVQYYLVFLLLWLAHSRGWLKSAILSLLLVQSIMAAGFLHRIEDVNYLFLWLHFFLMGTFISVLHHKQTFDKISRPGRNGQRVSALIALIASAAMLPGVRAIFEIPQWPIYSDPLVIASVFLFFTFTLLGWGIFSVFSRPAIRRLGDLSFGIYLIHIPVIFLVNDLDVKEKIGSAPSILIILALTYGLAELANRLVERPLGQILRRGLSHSRTAPKIAEGEQGIAMGRS